MESSYKPTVVKPYPTERDLTVFWTALNPHLMSTHRKNDIQLHTNYTLLVILLQLHISSFLADSLQSVKLIILSSVLLSTWRSSNSPRLNLPNMQLLKILDITVCTNTASCNNSKKCFCYRNCCLHELAMMKTPTMEKFSCVNIL